MIYTFPCSRQSTQHERKREMVSGHTGSGSLFICSSLNYPAEGSSVQQTSSCGGTVLVRTYTKERQASESRNEKKKKKNRRSTSVATCTALRTNLFSDRTPSATSRITLTSERSKSYPNLGSRCSDTDLPLSLPTPQTRMLAMGWVWSRVWPRGSIRFMVLCSRTISMSLPCRDAQRQPPLVSSLFSRAVPTLYYLLWYDTDNSADTDINPIWACNGWHIHPTLRVL